MDSRVTERAEYWVLVAQEKLGGLSETEANLARAAAVRILDGWSGPCWDAKREQDETDALGAMVAMLELARAIAHGKAWRKGPVAQA